MYKGTSMFNVISKLGTPLRLPIYFGLAAFFIGIPVNLLFSKAIGTTLAFSGFYLMSLVFIGSSIFHKEFSSHFHSAIKFCYGIFAIYLLILTEELHDITSVVTPSAVYTSIIISIISVVYGCFIVNNE